MAYIPQCGPEFFNHSKKIYTLEATIKHSKEKVWNAIIDADNWHRWFPGVIAASYGESKQPYGIGTRRFATVGKAKYEETILAWEDNKRFAYRIDRATVPIAHAQIESTELETNDDGTKLRWILACDRKLLLYLMAPFFNHYLQNLWNKAVANLENYLDTFE